MIRMKTFANYEERMIRTRDKDYQSRCPRNSDLAKEEGLVKKIDQAEQGDKE